MTDLSPAQKRRMLHREFIRRMQLAGYQTSRTDIVSQLKRAWLQGLFAVNSSTKLDAAQLDAAGVAILQFQLTPPTDSDVRRMSIEQRKCIIKLGKYVIGKVYGDGWFWNHLPEWTATYNSDKGVCGPGGRVRSVSRLDDLTMGEAVYVIRVMEQIEYRIKTGRGDS